MSAVDKPIFLCDMDDTMFDWSGKILSELQKIASPNETPPTLENWRELAKAPYYKERVELIKAQKNFYRNLPLLQDGVAVYEAARAIGYDCHFLTKGPYFQSQGWTEKYDCIREHFGPAANIHIVMDKSLVYGAVLFDDHPDYLTGWLAHRPRGICIMPDRPQNQGFQHERVIRYFPSTDSRWNLKRIYGVLEYEYELRISSRVP